MRIRGNSECACAIASLVGLALSLYALHVERELESDASYRPMCDIASYVSCSKAFRSSFARGLGVAPAVLGPDHPLTQARWATNLSVALSIFMNILSVYLFGVLVYLQTVCVVCVSIYIVNAVLLYFSFRKLRSQPQPSLAASRKKQ
ncbi:unnamed protein product [Gongylonema pulchrum]|uniref:vitamin-K-epoxide reductase (warfarin-sensitive) n=1 Tax=Gongylonema pulchrum TaxID=637853 RepID=A0A183DXN4_9BILA|nr:unnamed protein product [Gongylonema pulchrum]